MLRDLHIRNLAVVEEASVELGPGLNVLTGETGAGKSIVVDALELLAGARASAELLRTGADVLSVTGRFEPRGESWRRALAGAGLDAGEELVVRREISREGRNRVFIDDRPVTLGLLSSVAGGLLRIHGQREELGLAGAELQRELLDRSGGDRSGPLLAAVERTWERYRELADRLERVIGDDRLRAERIDLLRFQLGEIRSAELVAGEEDELRGERSVLRHSEAIVGALGTAVERVLDEEGSVVERLSQVERLLDGIVDWEPAAREWVREIEELRIRGEELASTLRDRLESVGAEPGRLDAIEERLALLERLFRKYGGASGEVLEHEKEAALELEQLEGDAENRDALEQAVGEALEEYRKAAAALSSGRAGWAGELAARVHRELGDLALGRARFSVVLDTRRSEGSPLQVAGAAIDFGAAGYDQVRFELAANPGEEPRPLATSASGGELSRIYLALQLAVRGDGPGSRSTMVFDEVDAGLGGEAASALGRKLQRLARGGQILAVTHLPQVASHADRQFHVAKSVNRGRTRTSVRALDRDGRVAEIARMLAGEGASDLSRAHAEELLTSASSD